MSRKKQMGVEGIVRGSSGELRREHELRTKHAEELAQGRRGSGGGSERRDRGSVKGHGGNEV